MDAITPRYLFRSGWTDERVAILKAEWEAKTPCSKIAKLLDITRNAVIGKVNRLGMPKRPRSTGPGSTKPRRPNRVNVSPRLLEAITSRPVPSTRAQRMIRQKEIAAIRAEVSEPLAAPVVFDPAHRVLFGRLKNKHCRYPLWADDAQPHEKFFCGAPEADIGAGRPYCPGHRFITLRPMAGAM